MLGDQRRGLTGPPLQKERFTAADAGLEVGMIVETYPPQEAGKGEVLIWDGEKPTPMSDFRERIVSGELKRGPRNRAALKAGSEQPPEFVAAARRGLRPEETGPGALRARLTRWAKYTEEFIKRYALDEDQAQKARQVLHDAEERARQAVASRREPLSQVEADLETAAREQNQERRAEADRRLKDLLRPLDDLFNDMLKPRLESIPTRKQRETAETRAKSEAAAARDQVGRP